MPPSWSEVSTVASEWGVSVGPLLYNQMAEALLFLEKDLQGVMRLDRLSYWLLALPPALKASLQPDPQLPLTLEESKSHIIRSALRVILEGCAFQALEEYRGLEKSRKRFLTPDDLSSYISTSPWSDYWRQQSNLLPLTVQTEEGADYLPMTQEQLSGLAFAAIDYGEGVSLTLPHIPSSIRLSTVRVELNRYDLGQEGEEEQGIYPYRCRLLSIQGDRIVQFRNPEFLQGVNSLVQWQNLPISPLDWIVERTEQGDIRLDML
jgi:hypothetical protein